MVSQARQPRTAAARSYDSPWLLSGLNLERRPFFTCKRCGGKLVGVRDSSRHLGNYVCGAHHYKGNAGCTNNIRIKAHILERELINHIKAVFADPTAIEKMVAELNSRVAGETAAHDRTINKIERQLTQVRRQIDRTFQALDEGLDSHLCKERLAQLKDQRQNLMDRLDQARKQKPVPLAIDPAKALGFFRNLKNVFSEGTNEQKRLLYRTYIRRMVHDPDTGDITVVFYPPYLQENIKRGCL